METGAGWEVGLIVALGVYLAIPLALASGARGLSRRLPLLENGVLDGYLRSVRRLGVPLLMAAWCVTMAAIDPLARLAGTGRPSAPLLGSPLFLGPPLLLAVLTCALLHREVARAATGRPALIAFRAGIQSYMIVILLVAGVVVSAPRMARLLAALLVSTLIVFSFLRRHTSPKVYALGPCALVSSADGIAHGLGVSLKGVYLVPEWLERDGRYQAFKDGALCLPRRMVEALAAPELDGVMAAEIARISKEHIRRLWGARVMALLVLMSPPTVSQAMSAFVFIPWRVAPDWGTMVGLVMSFHIVASFVALQLLVVRAERLADEAAAAAATRPELVACGLRRLLESGVRGEQPFTFESALRGEDTELLRLRRLRRLHPTADASCTAPPYELETPARRVFSREAKSRISSAELRYHIAVACGVPVLAAFVLPRFLPGAGPAGILIGGVATALLMSWNRAWMTRQYARIARGLGVSMGGDVVGLVGLAGPHPRYYEGLPVYDVGTVSIASGELTYRGELGSFRLPLDAIIASAVARATPGWLPLRKLQISWRDEEGATSTVALVPLPTSGLESMRARVARLAEAISSEPQAAATVGPRALAPPEGTPPRDLMPPRKAVTKAYVAGVCAPAFAVLFGFDWGRELWPIGLTAALGWLLFALPFMLHRDRGTEDL